jgi:transposase
MCRRAGGVILPAGRIDRLTEFAHFVGIDWGSQAHQVCLMAAGRRPEQRQFRHRAEGLTALVRWLETCGDPGTVAVGIEVPHGAIVETLQERGFMVFSLNPKQLDRFRDRHSVSGAKDDRRDAFVLADALRSDLHKFKRVPPADATTQELREVSRCYDDLQADLRRLSNRLWEQLQRYFPQLLELCPGADAPWFWELLGLAADPGRAATLPKRRVTTLLARHRKRTLAADDVITVLRTPPLTLAPGSQDAALFHVALLLPQLRVTHAERQRCEQRLAELIERAGRTAEIVNSHQGVGPIVTARLLAEAPQALAEGDLEHLRTLAGTAPVTRRSGKSHSVSMRRGCSSRLRDAVRHWARSNARTDPYGRALYWAMRARGLSHERALRGLADRLLTCLIATLRDDVLYDPARRARHLSSAVAA